MKEVNNKEKVNKVIAPKQSADLGIWSKSRDKERIRMLETSKILTCNCIKNYKNDTKFVLSSEKEINYLLGAMSKYGDFFYSDIDFNFDALMLTPILTYNKYALVSYTHNRVMLIRYQVMARLSYKLKAIARFIDDKCGFRFDEFTEFIDQNISNILPCLVNGNMDNVCIASIGPQFSLFLRSEDVVKDLFKNFGEIRIFRINDKVEGNVARSVLYSEFPWTNTDEQIKWGHEHNMYNVFTGEMRKEFEKSFAGYFS